MIIGLELVQRLYSEGYYIEEQREFGIKRSILKTIVKSKNAVMDKFSNSKLGDKVIDKLEKSIKKSINKRNIIENDIKELDKKLTKNPKLEQSLINKVPEKTYLVDAEGSGRNFNTDLRNNINKNSFRKRLRFQNSKDKAKFENSNDGIVFDRSNGGNSALAHEIGHVKK